MSIDKNKKIVTPAHIITLSFFIVIFFGASILSTSFVTNSGERTDFLTALFTATSAVCVTGLSVVSTLEHWNLLGKTLILILIQIGALGFISLYTVVLAFLGKKITLKDRLIIQESFNLSNIKGIVKFLKNIVFGTLFIEGIGALVLSFRFIPKFGFFKGIFISIFHSVSAFCNAGFDILGDNSLINYSTDYLVNLTLICLIILGGLGFTVWIDLITLIKEIVSKKSSFKCAINKLSLHTKLVLTITFILIFIGWVIIFIIEYNNKNTIGNLRFDHKLLASLFQAVTLRTAGFFSIDQGSLLYGSKFISIILMIIGGSPGGTAGGIKTVTIGILIFSVISLIKGRDSIIIFKRSVNYYSIQKAFGIIILIINFIFIFTMLLTITEVNMKTEYEFIDLLFETTSALATVGLSTGITPYLSTLGKIIIILCMFIGRLGPITITLAFSFKNKLNKSVIKYPEGKILIG